MVQVDLRPYSLAFRRPLRTAVGTFARREGIVVRVTDGVYVGWGEAAPLPGFSDDSLADVREALARWQALDPEAEVGGAAFRSLPEPPAARHGAEQALLGLVAARRGTTVAHLLTPEPRPTVPVNAIARDAQTAREAVARGARCVKLKVGYAPLQEDVLRVREVREAVGSEVAIRLDANRGWDEPTARAAIEALAPLDLELIEEPVGDLRAMARLRGPVPLAADESVRSEADLERVLALKAADAVVVKPMMVGGLLPAVRMLRRADQEGLAGLVTTSLEGAIGRFGALHVAAACDVLPCGLDTGRLLVDEPWKGFDVRDGEAILAAGFPPCP